MSSYEIPSYSVISPISVVYALSPPPPPRSLYNPYADPPPLPPPPPTPVTPPTEDAQPPTVLSQPPTVLSPTPVCTKTSPPPPLSIDYAPPPSSTPSPSPTLSPPSPSVAPSPNSPVPLSLPSSPPLPLSSPPSIVSPPISFIYSSPPPPPPLIDSPTSSLSPSPLIDPPRSSPSPPPSAKPPPTLPSPSLSPPPSAKPPPNLPSPSPPPPLVEPPTKLFSPPPPSSSPPPPVLPPPSRSHTPPSNSPVPPPIPSPPSHPSNSSGGITHSPPSVRSPTAPSVPPFHPYTNSSSRIPFTPSSASSSDYSQNDSKGLGRNSSPKSSGVTTENVATIAVVTCFFMLTFVGAAMLFLRKRRYPLEPSGYADGFELPSRFGSPQITVPTYPRSASVPLVRYSSGSSRLALSEPGLGNSKLWFMYEELSTITSGFSSNNLLGEGGFGLVYKGCLRDDREVAVKQLKVGGAQGEREFRAEVEIISRVHHRHLVSLVGYCISEQHRLLVYDYVPNNTLYYHLHGNVSPALDWATRVKVASGAARGIAYLHEDCHPKIIHRDIKSSNILLDNNFEAQVSDFGLARLARDACTHVSTRVMGTFGYMAPEYASTGKLTAKSDVYSFGVVLLELVTGRKPVDSSQPMGDESLVEWARPLLSNALENRDFGDLPDPRLENNYNESEMFRMVEAAAACVRHSVVMRPRMGQVVRALDNLSDMDINNGVKPGQSQLFASGPQTEEIIRFQRRGFGSQDSGSDFSRASWRSRTYL